MSLSRRTFLGRTAATAGLVAGAPLLETQAGPSAESSAAFVSPWRHELDRVWIGREFWANPLQDWRIADGRLECVKAAPNRHVHLLTRRLGAESGGITLSVRVGRIDGGLLAAGRGSFGFRIGVQGPLQEYRNDLIYGKGLDAGWTSDGKLFIDRIEGHSTDVALNANAVLLLLEAEPQGSSYRLILTARDADTDAELGRVVHDHVHASRLVGNVALVANFPAEGPANPRRANATLGKGADRFWFDEWRVSGKKLERHDERAFGPILFSQYTLHDGVLKLTAQMPPLGADDDPSVALHVERGGTWHAVARQTIHPEARTATFRIPDWPATEDVPYRLVYGLRAADGSVREFDWRGTIRREPIDQEILTVADISCNTHAAFPNTACVENMAKLNPDVLAFVGDQFYESTGGYGVQRAPLDMAILDYLRKWYMHGWTWRELTKDRPSVALPDDHDVYQGNIWGEGGAPMEKTQEAGGYNMHQAWVNVVHRTQTSHHPDPYDPTPIKQNITVYYGPMTYGGVSFAIIADRQFKSAPEGKVPPTGGRGDHVKDPHFDPRTADLPGLELLGERQMRFLRDWITDWRRAEMKAVISQTIFTAMATTHGGQRERLVADYDANGWPQSARNEALRVIRKAFAVHLAGDQHLPAVVHYGIETHNDAGVAFAGPAINVGYPRWFEPDHPGANRRDGAPENTGEFLDHFGNPLTVIAVKNGEVEPRRGVLEQLQDRASGIGLVRFDKRRRRITIECWPLLADPTEPGTQFPGWPVTIHMLDNYGRAPAAYLPRLRFAGSDRPVVEVVEESTGELLYNLRVWDGEFQPHVFRAGTYTIHIIDPQRERRRSLRGVASQATPAEAETLDIQLD